MAAMANTPRKMLRLALGAAAVALLAFPAPSAHAQVSVAVSGKQVTGTPRADFLKGGRGNDVLRGARGKDRLRGGGGNDTLLGGPGRDKLEGGAGKDRLIGGPGKDIFACGPGKDRVQSTGGDMVASSCEIVNGKQGSQGGGGGVGGGDVGGGGAPLPTNCRYVTKTVYVLGLNGLYTLEPRVVYECDGVEKPCPAKPDSPWRSQLQQGGGWRFHYAPVLKSLYRFTNDGVCGFYRGTRTTYPTGSLEYGETYPFAWSLDGNELTLQFVGGYVEKVQLLGYDSGDDRIDRTVSGAAAPPYFGCGSPSFPTFYLLAGICPP
jgi:hypothetical protein